MLPMKVSDSWHNPDYLTATNYFFSLRCVSREMFKVLFSLSTYKAFSLIVAASLTFIVVALKLGRAQSESVTRSQKFPYCFGRRRLYKKQNIWVAQLDTFTVLLEEGSFSLRGCVHFDLSFEKLALPSVLFT